MRVGDYIACNYTATSGAVGTFSGLGAPVGSEIPITGAVAPNGYFYLLKAARGLLIADRVIQNNITWDTLNTSGMIEGVRSVETFKLVRDFRKDLIKSGDGSSQATITTNTASNDITFAVPTGTYVENNRSYLSRSVPGKVFVSFEIDPVTRAGFDKSDMARLYLEVARPFTDSSAGYLINKKGIMTDDGVYIIENKDWTKFTLYYDEATTIATILLDDSLVWTGLVPYRSTARPVPTIYKVGFTVGSDLTMRFKLNNLGMDITSNAARNILPLTPGGYIRSLTGGIGPMDKKGVLTATVPPADFGLFPPTNEYDTYMVQSTLGGKIKAGDDNVWHTTGCMSWTQDTPYVTTFTARTGATYSRASDSRVTRGWVQSLAALWNSWSPVPTSTLADYYGFRPVFQYTE